MASLAMTMHMPTMAPQGPSATPALRPASPASIYQQHQQSLSNVNHSQAVGASALGQVSAVSNLSLALPLSMSQGPPQNAVSNSTLGNAVGNLSDGSIGGPLRVKLIDMMPEDGAPSGVYMRTVENLSNSLARHNAAIIELGVEDATIVRCALESAKLYFRSRVGSGGAVTTWGGGADWIKSTGYVAAPSRELYLYRAGRSTYEDIDSPPPGMPEVFRCLGKASRASLSAIARHLRLRGDVFGPILDDSPLPAGETSSSVLTATSFHPYTGMPGGGGKAIVAADSGNETEKGLLMLVASDTPGLQVCDANGRWLLADNGLGPGDLILLTGRALQHATAGLRKVSTYRVISLGPNAAQGPRTSLAFRLMPRSNATIDSSAIADAGHSIPEGYGPVTVAAFMDGLTATDALTSNGSENSLETMHVNSEPTLRSVLCDPLSGALLEDAMVAHCGHSFGGQTLKRVRESNMCSSCGQPVEGGSLIPNLALRAAALAFGREEQSRQLQGVIRAAKRRKEPSDQADPNRLKRPKQDHPTSPTDKENTRSGAGKGVQYPFSVNERVMIKGNKRTPEKFVGREAHITSQCLNGWYLLKTLDNGESVRLQYRSLQKAVDHNGVNEDHTAQGAHQ